MIRNGVLRGVLESHPGLEYLSLHNVDTLGATADPALLGRHIASGAAITIEVTPQRVNGRPRLVEGLALPSDAIEASLTFYNTELRSTICLTRSDCGAKTWPTRNAPPPPFVKWRSGCRATSRTRT